MGVTAYAPMRTGYLAVSYTRRLAREVRQDFGRIYGQETPEEGWKMALKNGYRIVRVTVTVDPVVSTPDTTGDGG